jgi:polysaccharide biosynthesis transport protein
MQFPSLPSSSSTSSQLAGQPTDQSASSPASPIGAAPIAPMPPASGGDFDIRQFLGMLKRRAIVIAGVAGIAMAASINGVLNQQPVYKSSFRLLVEPVNAEDSISDITQEGQNSTQGLDYDTQIQVLRSPELMTKLVEQLKLLYPDLNPGTVVGNLSIVRLGRTKILEVSYQDNDPAKVQAVLEQAVQIYLRYSLAERQTNLRQGIQFVEKQLPFLQERVDALQDELQIFRQRYDFTDPDSQSEQISSQTNALTEQKQEIEQQLAQARFNLSTVQGETGGIATLNESETYQQQLGQLRGIENQIATELIRFQPQSLAIRVLQEKRAVLLPGLRREAENAIGAKLAGVAIEIQSLEIQKQAIAQAEAELKVQTQQLPILSRNYVDLQRELEIATNSLDRFQTSRETLQIQAAQTEIPWQLIQAPAAPGLPLPSNISRSLLMGLLVSLGLGVGAAMGLEKLDSSFHTVEDLKAQTRLPVLGALPLYKPLENGRAVSRAKRWLSKRLIKQQAQRRGVRRVRRSERPSEPNQAPISSSFMEALRVLHTNLRLLNAARPVQAIVVSSASPGDGKSTVAFHLAQTARAMGQKVLLVDTDLRRPQIHQWLNVPNQQYQPDPDQEAGNSEVINLVPMPRGLSDVITNNLSIREALVRVYPDSNFFALTAGTVPADPTQLLASTRMQQLMEQFHRTFDLVIYDAPPLLGLADASLLASHTNGLVLVARLNKTDRTTFNQALDSLKVGQVPVLGVVANGLPYQSFDFYDADDDEVAV